MIDQQPDSSDIQSLQFLSFYVSKPSIPNIVLFNQSQSQYYYQNIFMLLISSDAKFITDYLTKYLKYFKANFHLQLAIIESIYNREDQIPDNINKYLLANQSADTEIYNSNILDQIKITKQALKTVERFFMRINEFMDYRVIKTNNLGDKALSTEINKIVQSLQLFVSNFSKQIQNCEFSLLHLFMKLNSIEAYSMVSIFKNILKSAYQLALSKQNKELIEQLITQIKLDLKSKYGCQEEQTKDSSSVRSKSIKNYEFQHYRHQVGRHKNGRRATIQSHVRIMSMSIFNGENQEGAEMPIRNRAPTEKSYKFKSTKTSPYNLLSDVLDIQFQVKQSDQKGLYKILLNLNKRNGLAIKQFIKQTQRRNKHKRNISHNLSTRQKNISYFQNSERDQSRQKRTNTIDTRKGVGKIDYIVKKPITRLPIIKTNKPI